MPPGHTFNVVIVSAAHGVGGEAAAKPDRTIDYAGAKIEAKL
ncbi:MAG: hypothetical protein WB341_07975 [Terracidiphilus sp.]